MRRLGRVLAVLALVTAGGVGRAAVAGADASGPVAFNDPAPETTESRTPVRVVVDRTDLPVSKLVVRYSTEDGSAQAGSDYVESFGTLVFDVGVRSTSFFVQLRDDHVAEPTEDLVLRLTTDRATTTARLTILDDDAGASEAAADGSSTAAARASRSSGGSGGSGGSGASVPTPTDAAAPVAAAPQVRVQQTQVRRRVVAAPRRRVVVRQNPVTPFELRPAPSDADADKVTGSLPNDPTAVDPVLALLAGLLLARVSAEVWFRSRAVPA